MSEPQQLLERGLQELTLSLPSATEERLLAYLQLLARWNEVHNLTAIKNPLEMVTRHLLDSLAVLPYLRGKQFIDVGTGAGIPGIVLAIACPDTEWELLDSNGKKTRFLFQVKTTLGLDNISVCHHRVEQYHPSRLFDGVVSRAFASLADMVRCCRHLLAEGGVFLAMKGQWPEQELADLTGLATLDASYPLNVPGLAEARHLLVLEPDHNGSRGNTGLEQDN